MRDNTGRKADARELKEEEELAISYCKLKMRFKLSSTKEAELSTQVGPLTYGVGLWTFFIHFQ